MRAGGDSEFESVYEPLSRSDEVDIKRDYLGKLGRVMDLLLPPCETETAIALDFVLHRLRTNRACCSLLRRRICSGRRLGNRTGERWCG